MAKKETVIQLGEGRFLRGFANYSFQKMQDKGLPDGPVATVQPIEKGMCSVLEQQGCEYNLFLRGIDNRQAVGEHAHTDTISRCMNSYDDFEVCMKLAENPDFHFIVFSTMGAGIEYVGSNQFTNAPTRPSPDKLAQLLYKRCRLGLKGFIILSYKLIDHDGEELEKCYLRYAKQWELGEGFKTWLARENNFCSTLVDRIITGFPGDEHEEFCRRIGEQDNMMGTAEIFHLWVIQGSHEDELLLQKAGFHMVWTDNVGPYKKRKVRILNGAHIFTALGAHLYGLETVGECLRDEKTSVLLRKYTFREIIPAIGDIGDNRKFEETVLERSSNPLIRRMLLFITLNSVPKFRAGVLLIILEYRDMFGSCPQGLIFSPAALMAFYHTDDVNDSQETMDFMETAPVEDILKRKDY